MSRLSLSNSGEFTPHIVWKAQTSSWEKSVEGGGRDQFQFTQAIIDIENVQQGWGYFAAGEAPEWVMDPSLSQKAPKPNDGREWKRGFKVKVFSKALFGDAEPVREFGTTATGAGMGMEELDRQYLAQKDANPNKVPVVEYKGPLPTKVGKGSTNVPQLAIVKWVDRPAELQGQVTNPSPVTPAQTAPQVTAHSTSSNVSEF